MVSQHGRKLPGPRCFGGGGGGAGEEFCRHPLPGPHDDSRWRPRGADSQEFFPVVTEHAKILHKYHPNAKIWIAPQSFAPEPGWLETFYQEVAKEPDWLYGICFAPWEKDTLEELREHLPPVYRDRIRHYPDITHNTGCQFEVPQWDRAFALTLGREGNNTRPKAMKHIHNLHAPLTVGSLTYSEGIHDDVNKMVWGDQDFSTKTPCEETVEDYVRLFISPDLTDTLSQLILSLEDYWKDPSRITKPSTGFIRALRKSPQRAIPR